MKVWLLVLINFVQVSIVFFVLFLDAIWQIPYPQKTWIYWGAVLLSLGFAFISYRILVNKGKADGQNSEHTTGGEK